MAQTLGRLTAPVSRLRESWRGDVLAAVSGGLMVLGYAPFGWWPVVIVSPAVLMALWVGATPGMAFRRGFVFGLAWFTLGIYWVYNSIHEFGGAPAPLAAGITLLFILYLSLFPAFVGWLSNRWFSLSGAVTAALVYPVVWSLLEWVRTWLLTGFPWLLPGEAHADTPLGGIVPVLGVLGATWASLASSGILAAIAVSRGSERRMAAVALVVIWSLGAVIGVLDWTRPAGEPFVASLVQGNVSQGVKWDPDALEPTKLLYRDLTEDHWDSDLVLWPEAAVPVFYSDLAWSYFLPLAERARETDTTLVTGIFAFDNDTDRVYNSLARVDTPPDFYHKRHLVPFGEYLPLRGLLMWMDGLLFLPMSDISSGMGRPLLSVGDLNAGATICYEDAFGNEVIDALPEADFLINVSNDAWFGDSLAPHQHLMIARLRALETGRYLLRATNTGISAVMDQKGRIVARSPQFETDVLTTSVIPFRGMTPYAIWGNLGVVTALLVCLLIILAFAVRSRRAFDPGRRRR
ncbi:MAG: apolipoprotein N-acyltransferase [Pseudomonadota bacterium]|nr:apolipoprotein N-acyltransferase [Pseudomonadota bacterium]